MRHFLTLFIVLISTRQAFAFEARAFVSGDQFKAQEMNDALDSAKLKPIKQMLGFGVEANVETIPRIRFGLRFESYHLHVGDGSSTTLQPDPGFSELTANMYQVVMRWSLIDGAPLRFDVFGGAGGVNAIMKSKAAGGMEYEQGLRSDDMRFMQTAGGTLAFGNGTFYVTFEGGYHWATVSHLKHDLGATPSVDMIDLRGPFGAIGIVFIPNLSGKSSSKSK